MVNVPRGQQLGMLPDNALLVSTGVTKTADVVPAVKRLAGGHVTLATLAGKPPSEGEQTAVLTGGSVADSRHGSSGTIPARAFHCTPGGSPSI